MLPLLQALSSGALAPLAQHLPAQQLAWLQGHLSAPPPARAPQAEGAPGGGRRTDLSLLADMLAGGSERGRDFSGDFYGCLLSFAPARALPISYHVCRQEPLEGASPLAGVLAGGSERGCR